MLRTPHRWLPLLASVLLLWLAGCGDDESSMPPAQVGGGGAGASTSAGGTTSSGGSSSGGGGTGGSVSGVDVVGYWLWYQQVEDDQVTLQIEEEDLQIGDWPGCPSGIICTHYGIMKLAFGSNGQAHFIFNVPTSSDYQTPGTYTVDGDLLHYLGSERYSCAHPDQDEQTEREGYARLRLEGGNLWVSVTGFQGFQLPMADSPPTDPSRWIVFRPISQAEFYGSYMIRVCQSQPNDPCHEDCSSMSLIGESG